MARYIGSKAVAYVSATGTGNAVNKADVTKWSLGNSRDLVDVTACGDANRKYVQSDIEDYKGAMEFFFDDTNTVDLFTSAASTDGVVMYLYPSSSATTRYFYGPAWVQITNFDTGGINGPIKLTVTWASNGTWAYKLS